MSCPTADADEAPAAANAAVGARPRILIVEDEDAVRSLLEEFLSMRGYEVDCATNAVAALAAVRAAPPAIVLLDICMPGELTGDQILPMLVGAGVTVIIVSGSIDDPLQARVLQTGAFDFVAKPFTLARLQEAVAAAEGVPRPRLPASA